MFTSAPASSDRIEVDGCLLNYYLEDGDRLDNAKRNGSGYDRAKQCLAVLKSPIFILTTPSAYT